MNIIIKETDRLNSIVTKILTPPTKPSFGPFNIHSALENVYALAEADEIKHINLIRDYDPSIPEINGDEKIKSISAASIIAKVYRDELMIKLSEKFQNYAWERNFGYGTKAHMEGLRKFGITSHHRKGFKPIHKMLSN